MQRRLASAGFSGFSGPCVQEGGTTGTVADWAVLLDDVDAAGASLGVDDSVSTEAVVGNEVAMGVEFGIAFKSSSWLVCSSVSSEKDASGAKGLGEVMMAGVGAVATVEGAAVRGSVPLPLSMGDGGQELDRARRRLRERRDARGCGATTRG